MKIVITEKNKDAITAAIKAAEGKSRERLATYDEIAKIIKRTEDRLGIPKKALTGVTLNIDINAQDFPRAYKYAPLSTHVTVRRSASGWALVDVYRATTRRKTQQVFATLTDDAKAALIKNAEQMRVLY